MLQDVKKNSLYFKNNFLARKKRWIWVSYTQADMPWSYIPIYLCLQIWTTVSHQCEMLFLHTEGKGEYSFLRLIKKMHWITIYIWIKTGHQKNGWQVFQLYLRQCIYKQNPCIYFPPFHLLFRWSSWDRGD